MEDERDPISDSLAARTRRGMRRRLDALAWEFVGEAIRKGGAAGFDASRPELREVNRKAPADRPALARDEESAARAGSMAPSDRTALRSPHLASNGDQPAEDAPGKRDPLPGVV